MFFFKNMGHSRPLFLHFRLFNTVDSNCSIKTFADDWIRTEDLLKWKRPLYQQSHNPCPTNVLYHQKRVFIGQSSKCSTIVNYDSVVVPTKKQPIQSMMLESYFLIFGRLGIRMTAEVTSCKLLPEILQIIPQIKGLEEWAFGTNKNSVLKRR